MNSLLTSSATRLASLIRNREVSSAEVVEAHIQQIRKVNPVINAVVCDRFDQARQEAAAADNRVKSSQREELPPFLGVPITIKEAFALTGMPNSSGLLARKGVISSTDAPTVARLREAGAIPLGVTNLSELCMWMESSNPVYGRTRNPYNPKRTAGGSSGGEGAIVGAGASPFGLGSDIGGSIRMPAFFNGVFGHKPSSFTVPNAGQHPISENDALRYLSTGPLCRRAEDLMPVLRLLAGPHPLSPEVPSITLGDERGVSWEGRRVIVIEDNGRMGVSSDLKQSLHQAAAHLQSRGAVVKTERVPLLKHSLEIWSSSMSGAGGKPYCELLGDGQAINPYPHLLKWPLGQSPYTLPSIVLGILEKLVKGSPDLIRSHIQLGRDLRRQLEDLMGEGGVLLYPPYTCPAPLHLKPLMPPFNWVYTGILNIMEFPVTVVPMGLNTAGLPLGVQVASAHGNDHLTIAAALELEQGFGGWTPPSLAQ